MREIKFRAWSPKAKIMAYNVGIDERGLPHYEGATWHNQILMQYTGLKDRNGKEVWEGDIVKRVYAFTKGGKPKETINQIIYREDWGGFAFYAETKIGKGFSAVYSGHQVFPWEIIGNIYENPELLK